MYRIGDLQDKRILVTGASSGIGAALGEAFAQQGARVALHGHRHAEGLSAAVQRIQQAGGHALALTADLGAAHAARQLVDAAAKGLDGLDVLVNNAGAIIAREPIATADDALLDRVFDLNGRAVFAACQAAVPHMTARGGGAIINVGSIAALDGGGRGAGLYASTKAFVHTLTRHLARDLASVNIRVNAVSPGAIETPFHAATPPERMQAMRAAIPMARLGVPADCVGAFLFLASNELSGYITGQLIHVNGGQAMP
ncbi:MAG: SDR family NAD(P)-dependent oxidoreductase [Steroidobacteraceae bacterium]